MGGEEEGKEKKLVTGGKGECREWVVSYAPAFVSLLRAVALLPITFWFYAHRPLPFDSPSLVLVLTLFVYLQSSAKLF